MPSRVLVLFCLLALAFSACAPAPAPAPAEAATPDAALTSQAALATMVAGTLAPTHTPALPTVAPTPTPVPTQTLAPAAAPGKPDPSVLQSLTQYRLDVEFHFSERYGKVTEEIIYTNQSGDALPDLLLVVALAAYPNLFSFTGMWWQDGSEIQNAAWEKVQVRVPLRQPLAPGERIVLKLAYEFRLPAQSSLTGERPLPIGYTSRQANLVDWYPFVPPYRSGKGWLSHPPAYYGEHLVHDLGDFEVNLRLTDARQDLVVAASASAQPDGEWLRYRREGARSFALSIGPEYRQASEMVDGVTVTSYYFPFSEAAGKRALQTTVESLRLFNDLFGPYPHDTLAVVQADFFDGMEYDGLYFLSRAFYNIHKGGVEDYLTAIAAHETAHMWFYGIIGSDQANEPWLDEALATYAERLYYEHYYPEALEWWWYYRINYYRPSGWVDTSVYNPQGTLQTYQDYRNAVYLNGAHFLEDLREVVGDDAFFAFLKDYATRFAGQVAFREDFFALLAEHSDADIGPVKEKYFANP
jgi:hypothetical protein